MSALEEEVKEFKGIEEERDSILRNYAGEEYEKEKKKLDYYIRKMKEYGFG